MNLASVKIGKQVRVLKLKGDQETMIKLRSLGVLEGDLLTVTGRGFMLGPIAVCHGSGHFFALRRSHAKFIEVVPTES